MQSISSRNLLFLLSLLFVILCLQPQTAEAQEFETGLELYQDGDYERAASAFNKLQDDRSYLFAGKSYYAMNRYQQAQANLNNISSDAPPSIYYESIYTSALIDFQLKEFGDALNKLYRVIDQSDLDRSLTLDANQLYGQILGYLTSDQRIDAITTVSASQVKFDILKSGMGKMEYPDAQELYRLFEASVENEWREKAGDIQPNLSTRSRYTDNYGQDMGKLEAPDGTIYNLGIALPEYQPDANEFSIVKSIYLGAFLASKEFNDDHRDLKASLHFIDTGTSTSGLRSSIEQFAENLHGDAMIGPLFSEQAGPMIPLANRYKIPVLAPLANSQINSTDSYLFQTNPTFAIHGREMARYAVEELGMKRFAIIARRGSTGAYSAEAFRDEAEKRGAQIEHYFVEDMRSNDYELSRFTQQFTSGENSIDAVYAPFTGQTALTLIDLLLVDLRVMTTPPAVLGSQEWRRLDYTSNKYSALRILYSQGYHLDDRGIKISEFRNKYNKAYGDDPNQFAMIGYDVASFLLKSLEEAGNPALLRSGIYNHPIYNGLVKNIQFDGDNVNRSVKIIEITGGGNARVR